MKHKHKNNTKIFYRTPLPLGARDLAQQKDTYRAQKAETAISKGDRNTQNMYYLESQNQAENGPQANPNPLN